MEILIFILIIIFTIALFVTLITLCIANSLFLKRIRSKVLWIIISCYLPVISLGVYYRYQGKIIIEKTIKLADMRLEMFRYFIIFICVCLVLLLQLIMFINY